MGSLPLIKKERTNLCVVRGGTESVMSPFSMGTGFSAERASPSGRKKN